MTEFIELRVFLFLKLEYKIKFSYNFLELGTWNLELGTWNLELGTWNLELLEKKPYF